METRAKGQRKNPATGNGYDLSSLKNAVINSRHPKENVRLAPAPK